MTTGTFDGLRVNPAAVAESIAASLWRQTGQTLKRSGIVVAMSGGVDSAVCAALAVRAVGPKRVLALALPERDSDPDSLRLARTWAGQLGIELVVEDITSTLEACGCYQRRDAAIRRLVPYGDGWRCKIVLENGRADSDLLPTTHLVVQPPMGEAINVRLPAREFREIVAASNFKQRVRKMTEYYHADRLHYAVMGTPNRLEYELGFFVRGGDGLADVKPIAHLYKSQVYQLAEYLGVPGEIRSRVPTTDTYSLPQTQEEFYFALPLNELDLLVQACNGGKSAADVTATLDLKPGQAERLIRDLDRRRQAAQILDLPALGAD